jgi:hypothetical protein
MTPGPESAEERARAAGEALLAKRQSESEMRTRNAARRIALVAATTLLIVLLLWWLQG